MKRRVLLKLETGVKTWLHYYEDDSPTPQMPKWKWGMAYGEVNQFVAKDESLVEMMNCQIFEMPE